MISEDRRLTEEFIYNHQGNYPVYSAQKDGAYGYIDEFSFEGEVVTVVQYGDSGKTFLRKGKLNIGRNVCGLVPKEDFKDKIDLRFIKYALEHIFIENSKGKDLKSLSQDTINRTDFFLPNIGTQEKIADEYGKLEIIKDQLETIQNKYFKVLK